MKNLIIYALAVILAAGTLSAQTVELLLENDYSVGLSTATPRYGVGDLNNDGFPDLVTLNQNNDTAIGPVSVFLNTTTGGFGPPINIQIASLTPTAVAVTDFNKDGNADLLIANQGIANAVHLRLGNGTGDFPSGTFLAVGERGSPAITTADYNGDGNIDVAICNNDNQLRVFNGDGVGSLGPAANFVTASTCQDLLTADFNVDGRPDIVTTARQATNSVQVFMNNGSSFNAPVNNQVNGSYSLVTADFNRDCIPDLASTQFAGSTVYILIGSGTGTFTSTSVAVNNSPAHMSVGDFNRDKKVDIAVRRNTLTAGANNLTILPGNGTGGFGTPFEASIAVPPTSTEMRLATMDANRDGKSDLVVGRRGGFLLFHGNSALFTRTESDFDGDLRSDLAIYRPATGTWYLRRSTAGETAVTWGLAQDTLAPGDFDGDGRTDLSVWRANGFGDPDRSYFFILRSSDGTLQQEQFGSSSDTPAITGDWDGDGRADVAVYRNGASAGAPSFFFHRPSGSPSIDFNASQYGQSGDEAVRGDFDGDRKLDLAVYRASDATWYVTQSSNGASIFQNWGVASDKRVVGDYDGDGKSDFAVYRPSTTFWYILNSSTGAASYRQWGTTGDIPAPADFNGDGTAEPTVYRPSDQTWWTQPCAAFTQNGTRYGTTGDTPVSSAYVQ